MFRIALATALVTVAVPALALDCPDGQRAFAHAAGETCIPRDPQRIAAPRGDSVATPLIDIGAPVIAAGFRRMEDGTSYLRGGSDIFGQHAIDALGLTDLGNPNAPDMEVLAEAGPDLVVLTEWQSDLLEQASAVAPAIVVPANLPFLEHLAFLADAAGMSGVYEAELAAYRDRVAELRDTVGAPEDIVVSRFDMAEDGLWFYPNWGAVAQVIADAGFAQPPIQAEATENVTGLSVERIGAFDGDVLIASAAPRFGQTVAALQAQWDAVAPFWRDLPGIAAGNLYWYPRDEWVGYTFTSLERAADGLELLTAGRDFD